VQGGPRHQLDRLPVKGNPQACPLGQCVGDGDVLVPGRVSEQEALLSFNPQCFCHKGHRASSLPLVAMSPESGSGASL
jgi:hypothetical protein